MQGHTNAISDVLVNPSGQWNLSIACKLAFHQIRYSDQNPPSFFAILQPN